MDLAKWRHRRRQQRNSLLPILLAFLTWLVGMCRSQHLQGPVLVQEPPLRLRLAPPHGGTLSCQAMGSPPPELRWLDSTLSPVVHLHGIREVLSNGSLYLSPLSGAQYAARYRCEARNVVGAVLSRETVVEAASSETSSTSSEDNASSAGTVLTPRVIDTSTLPGNVAMLRCQTGSSSRLEVTAWLREEPGQGRTLLRSGSRYIFADQSQTLVVLSATGEDAAARFLCQTRDRGAGGNARQLSLPGRLVLSPPPPGPGLVSPRIHAVLQGTSESRVGDPVELLCAAQGLPPPEYRWLRATPDAEVLRGSEPWLRIPSASTADAGQYVCEAANGAGVDRREILVRIRAPLLVRLEPRRLAVDAGAEAYFNCSVNGGAGGNLHTSLSSSNGNVPGIQWYKDGRLIRMHSGSSQTQLRLQNVGRLQAGMYQCEARLGDETALGTAELALGAISPEFLHTFEEITLTPGRSTSLQCVAAGTPSPHISWLLDGAPLRHSGLYLLSSTGGEDNSAIGGGLTTIVSQLNITSVRAHHGGLYTCLARNLLGSVSHSAPLNVLGPVSPRSPLNVTGVSGKSLTLRCPIAGYPLSSVSWRHSQDDSSSPVTPQRGHQLDNGSLVLHSLQAVDSGAYSCHAADTQGHRAQGRLHLHVAQPPQIAPLIFPTGLQEGHRAQVSCSVVAGDLPISIAWRKDGSPLPEEPAVRHQHHQFGSNLLFSDLAARHAGRYTCVASNGAAVATASGHLEIRVAPRWTHEPTDMSVSLGGSALVPCKAAGVPEPRASWRWETSDHAGVRQTPEGGLLIAPAQETHEGRYTCHAENGVGKPLSKTIFLDVQVPPHFGRPGSNASGVSGAATGAAILACEVLGDRPLHVTWRGPQGGIVKTLSRPIERLTPQGIRSELHLQSLTRSDAGSYLCQATNAYGRAETQIWLLVKEPPDAPPPPEIAEVGSRWVSVRWPPMEIPMLARNPSSTIMHHIVQFRLADSGSQWTNVSSTDGAMGLRLQNLLPDHVYELRLVAVNEIGAGPAGSITRFKTSQEAPSESPRHVEIESQTESFHVRWTPPPTQAVGSSSDILGYKIIYREITASGSMGVDRVRVVRGRQRASVRLPGLNPFTRYEVIIRAFNLVGEGPSSASTTASTLESTPDAPPEEVRCTTVTSRSIRMRWQPPPQRSIRGQLLGYKVFYQSIGSPQEVKRTSNLETSLHGLTPGRPYTVRVLAYTASGDGEPTPALTCRPEEEVPGPPAQIIALSITSDSVLVAWSPPAQRNGRLLRYTVFVQSGQDLRREAASPEHTHFEVRRLDEQTTYTFWVTASTSAGEGATSVRTSAKPNSRVPARVATFSGMGIRAARGTTATIPCLSVGLPAPTRSWRGPNGETLPARSDGSLVIGPLEPHHSGNYSCYVRNVFGADEAWHHLTVSLSPIAPELEVTTSSTTALTLSWRLRENGGTPVTSYTLSYRPVKLKGEMERDHENSWVESHLDSDLNFFRLKGLRCGCAYEMQLKASNSVGDGPWSSIITRSTAGTVPLPPSASEATSANGSTIILDLEAWGSGGCPPRAFTISYRERRGLFWTSLDEVVAITGEFYITPLLSATWYHVLIEAKTDTGKVRHEYVISTLPSTPLPEDAVAAAAAAEAAGLGDLTWSRILTHVIPVLSALLSLSFLIVCGCVLFVRRRRGRRQRRASTKSTAKTLAELQNERNRDVSGTPAAAVAQVQGEQMYSPCPGRKGSKPNLEKEKLGQDYEICPYATFSLPGGGGAGSGGGAMVYSLQLATLRQHECYSGSGEPPSPPLPPPPGIDPGSPHHRRSLEAGSSTESAEASPQPSCPPPVAVQHRSRRSTPTRHERGRSGPPLALPVMPPVGFSDSREFSETECDRGGTSARASSSGPNIELNTDMDQQLSTMAKSVAVHQHREQFRWLPGSNSPPMGSLGSCSNWRLSGGLRTSTHSALTFRAGPSGVPGTGLENISALYE